MTSLLQTTRQTDLEPLTASGLPVFQTFPQVRSHVRSSLGTEYAQLFAEPNMDPRTGEIQWYSPIGGVARHLSDLTGAEATAARLRIADITGRLEQHAAALQNGSADERQLGKVLADMLEVPGEGSIFMIGAE